MIDRCPIRMASHLTQQLVLVHSVLQGLGFTLGLSSCAVRIEHRTARLAVLGHEQLDVDVTALALIVHSGGVLVDHLLGVRCP